MVSEVFEYVVEDRSYAVTVFELSFGNFTDRDATWRNFYNAGRGEIWWYFDKTGRLNFNILIMLKMSVPLLLKTSIVFLGLKALTAV
jgi:hypothetical protein